MARPQGPALQLAKWKRTGGRQSRAGRSLAVGVQADGAAFQGLVVGAEEAGAEIHHAAVV
jgi:hypothetical protein